MVIFCINNKGHISYYNLNGDEDLSRRFILAINEDGEEMPP